MKKIVTVLALFLGLSLVVAKPATAQEVPVGMEIVGQAFSVNAKGDIIMPLSAYGWWANIALKKLDKTTGQFYWYDYTNCGSGVGCADQLGRYRFPVYETGLYKIEIQAWGHPTSRLEVEVSGPMVEVENKVKIAPAVMWRNTYDAIVLSKEGKGTLSGLTVCNLDATAGAVSTYGIIEGPSQTQQWDIALATTTSLLPVPEPWTCADDAQVDVQVDANLPNGEQSYLLLNIGKFGNSLGNVFAPFIKGGNDVIIMSSK